uniref:Uncharacterized protein n=1 Tax=Solanum lycopersicum TaxID=4081 RepID=A0A3Q7GEL6_SOLLC
MERHGFGNMYVHIATFILYGSFLEVRTGNSYDIVEDTFPRKPDESISPLPREDGRYKYTSGPPLPTIKSSTPSPNKFADEVHSPDRQQPFVEDESHTRNQNVIMIPLTPSVIQRENDNLNHKFPLDVIVSIAA